MPKFHQLTVKDIREETTECVSVSFEVPSALQEAYQFIQGQYLTLRATVNGEDIRRSYSICASPTSGDLRVAIKKVPGGRFSTFANEQLSIGDQLQVMTPMGNFYTQLKPDNENHYVAFAAGSGITPIISILSAVLETESKSIFTLFYGNRTSDSIIFKEQLEALKNRYIDRMSLHYFMSGENPGSALFHGRISSEKCEQLFQHLLDPKEIDAYFLCGPHSMILSIQEVLENLKIDPQKIHFELFTPASNGQAAKPKTVSASAKQAINDAQITIKMDGEIYQFPMPSGDVALLDAALKGGLDLPFSCKGGVCCTCRAKLLEGEVEMEVNYALEPDEIEAGYILTCQAHPLTKTVTIDYDS